MITPAFAWRRRAYNPRARMLAFIDGSLHIGNVSATDIADRFGTPVYVYDASVIRRQIQRVKRAFAALPFRPYYAMKANGALAVLDLVRGAGFGCDTVSPGEIFIARQAGFTPDNIWFTCSNVSDADLRGIGDERIVINVNSMSEIDRILALDLRNPIALRVNTAIGAGHHVDVVTAGGGVKFGIDLAEIETARMVAEDSGRKVVGLHAHIGSGIDDIAPLIESARRLLDLSTGFPNLRWLNFGGGISVPYEPGAAEFPIDDYGAELTRIADRLLRARDLTAILEPGRYLVAQSGTLLSQVTSKRISGGQWWIGVDTGFNHLARPSKYGAYHHIVNATSGSPASLRETFDVTAMSEEAVIAGNLCESGDVFTRNDRGQLLTRKIDRTKIGDLFAFCDAGAYGFSMASLYNARLLPPEVMVDGDDVRLIRERQTYEDLVRGML
ncbi:MAG: diaminopimelate decarboxylase [Thermoanaerobaculia bacterium]|jgi:diaminopimelate decarboxylase|nr:diaminopimelate decarboxylase [Thermoanaerobaculia bacterium]